MDFSYKSYLFYSLTSLLFNQLSHCFVKIQEFVAYAWLWESCFRLKVHAKINLKKDKINIIFSFPCSVRSLFAECGRQHEKTRERFPDERRTRQELKVDWLYNKHAWPGACRRGIDFFVPKNLLAMSGMQAPLSFAPFARKSLLGVDQAGMQD
jgi:hypothetical protein